MIGFLFIIFLCTSTISYSASSEASSPSSGITTPPTTPLSPFSAGIQRLLALPHNHPERIALRRERFGHVEPAPAPSEPSTPPPTPRRDERCIIRIPRPIAHTSTPPVHSGLSPERQQELLELLIAARTRI